MEVSWCKSFFVSLLVFCAGTSLLAGDDNLVIMTSSETEFSFVYDFSGSLSELSRTTYADSSVGFYRTVQVAVPPGGEVRLVSAWGRAMKAVDVSIDVGENRIVERPLVELAPSVLVRGVRMAAVRLNPLSASGIYGEVEVHLAFEVTRRPANLTAADDPRMEDVFASVLANYEQARHWSVERPVGDRSRYAGASLSAAETWYKIKVSRNGLTQLTGAQMEAAGVSLDGLNSDSIRIFYAGGEPNEVQNSLPRPTFEEIAVLVLDGGDGILDRTDRVIFYSEAVDRWLYRTGYAPRFLNNRYTAENVYWLAVAGDFSEPARRMVQLDGSLTGGVDSVVNSFWCDVHVEQDVLISEDFDGIIRDYYNWYWYDEPSISLYIPTPGAMEADSAYVYLDARTGGDIDLLVNGHAAVDKICSPVNCRFTTYALAGGDDELNDFDMQLTPVNASQGVSPYFNYAEIRYHRTARPVDDVLDVTLGAAEGRVELQVVDNFSGVPTVFDLSDPRQPAVIAGFVREGGLVRFRRDLATEGPNRFYCAVTSQAQAPLSVSAAEITDLRASLPRTDLIVIAPHVLAGALDDYVEYRRADGYALQVVSVEDIMDNFSYGLYDPTAIRDFLKFAYENYPTPAPSAVLFAGDATYDFMNHLGKDVANYVPPYIRTGDLTYGDDNYVYFGDYGLLDSDTSWDSLAAEPDRGYDMATARWPIRSTGEIALLMDRIRSYESSVSLGAWRSDITLVADDEFGDNSNTEIIHTRETENLENDFVPRELNRQKIYLWEYPFVNAEKPDVNDAIVRAFNNGSLLVNYMGHGNPDVWAHEHVFSRTSDIPRLTNADKLALVFAASCAIGFVDDPSRQSMAEDFFLTPNGGAIGVVSANRRVNALDNASFNREVFRSLLYDKSLTVCEAMFAGKLRRQYPGPSPESNDRAYMFLGDPCLELGLPRLDVELSLEPDSLVALGRNHLSGTVRDGSGQVFAADGTVLIRVFDSDLQKTHAVDDDTLHYDVAGARIFRGSAGITDGHFESEFITPLDIGYGGSSARISVYAVFDSTDGLGLVDSIAVSRTLVPVVDSTGPVIEYGLVGRSSFVSGDMITPEDCLEVTLADSSGINLAGGIGHGIMLVIDDQLESAVTLTDLFEYEQDRCTVGRLEYRFSDLDPGNHHLKVKAWDNANNMSTAEFDVAVVAAGTLAINDLLNYPNPMGEETSFYFELTQAVERFNLEIFTLSGKRIWNCNLYGLGADYYPNEGHRIVWRGRDADGDRVASGVYIYKATAVAQSDGRRVEQFGKVVVVN